MGRILYIHGFASCGDSNKSRVLREHFGEDQVLNPNLPFSPANAIRFLERELLQHRDIDLLVGSSLGGYYADWLNSRYQIPSVLINPSTVPFETLESQRGEHTRYCDGETFIWDDQQLFELQKFFRPVPARAERYLVLLQTGDEILDYRLAAQRYREKEVIIEDGGNHRFENLGDYLKAIEQFRQSRDSINNH